MNYKDLPDSDLIKLAIKEKQAELDQMNRIEAYLELIYRMLKRLEAK